MRRHFHVQYVAIGIIFIVFGAAMALVYSQRMNTSVSKSAHTISLAGTTVSVTVADTPEGREKGLGGRSGLGSNEGMLFVFPQDGIYMFWMKDMRFAIDMIWLTADRRVQYIEESVAPETYPQAFGPQMPARYVLEVPAGWAKKHGLRIGDAANYSI